MSEKKTESWTSRYAALPIGPYELYILALSAFALVVLGADTLLNLSPEVHEVLAFTDLVLCGLFFMDFVRNMVRAESKTGYFLHGGWLDLISSIPAIDLFRLGRLSRIVRITRLLRATRSLRTIKQVLARQRKQSAVVIAAIVAIVLTVSSSIAILQLEQGVDANIRSGGDALWWAFGTITTVGYGELYPVTLEGRIVASILMFAGVGLFGTLSGLLATWFLHEDIAEESDHIRLLANQVSEIRGILNAHFPASPEGNALRVPANDIKN